MSSSKGPAPPKTVSNPPNRQQTELSALFVLSYNGEQVLVARPQDYAQLQFSIRDHFPNIPDDHRVWYFTKDLPICKGVLTKISREIWASTISNLDHLIVRSEVARVSSPTTNKRSIKQDDILELFSGNESGEMRPPQKKRRHEALPQSASNVSSFANGNQKLTLNIHHINARKHQSIDFSPSTTIRQLWSRISEGYCCGFRMVWSGRELKSDDDGSLVSLGISRESTISVITSLRGGKPVIYLLPPSGVDIDASVKLSLVPEWHFSGIYPVVPITFLSSGEQSLKWEVKASPDGTLLEKNTGLEVAYLFWEADALALSARPPIASAPIPEQISTEEVFIPTQPQLSPQNSVVLEVSKMTTSLDSALKALGLHVEARTSFITYWLPSFLKHTYVALRFLPQSAYEHAAPLEVEPKPDVVVRVFMLFKGLKEGELSPGSQWHAALNAGAGDPTMWRSVVGVDENSKLSDAALFRVIEWGGMEVLS